MKVLQMYQQLTSYVNVRADSGIHAPKNSASDTVKTELGLKLLLPMSSFGIGVALSVMFFCYEAKTFEEYAECLYMVALIISNLFSFIFQVAFVGGKIFALIDKFETLIATRLMNPESKSIYEKANALIESWTTLTYFYLMKISIPCVMIPPVVLSYFLYFITDLKEDSFYMAFPTWFPFDRKNPKGYFFACCIQLPTIVYCVLGIFRDLTFAVAACWMVATFTDDVKAEINALNQRSKTQRINVELTEKLGKLIEFHSMTKRIASKLTDAFEIIYTVYFVWITFALCDLLLMFHIGISHGTSIFDVEKVLRPIFSISWATFMAFVSCESGEIVTSRFDEIDLYQQFDWYIFPGNIQRLFPMIIINMRKTVAIRSFGNIPCARETFKKIVNAAFSYYLVLRIFLK